MSQSSTAISVLDHGATREGQGNNARAIQKCIDLAAASGGTVVFPPGVYRTGTLVLRSGTRLEPQPGAEILGSTDINDYPPLTEVDGDRHGRHLIYAEGCDGITICGGGRINGSGPAFWNESKGPRVWIVAKSPRVSPMIEIVNCRNVRLQDVQITNSPGWTCHLRCCEQVWIHGVMLRGNLFGPNTDGFDINGCRHLMISDCDIECGDDAICLKTSADSRSCERITVTNCVIRTNCVALKVGTESHHDFKDITFSNCVVHQSTRAVGLYVFDGGTCENVLVSNISADTNSGFILNRPIHIDLRKRDVGTKFKPMDQQTIGRIRNVIVSGMVARTDGRILVTAADGGRIEGLTLRDVVLDYPAVDDPMPTGGGAGSAQFSNHSPQARVARAAVVVDQVDDLVINNLQVRWPKPGENRPWGLGAKIENGGNRVVAAGTSPIPMNVVWGRGLKGGMLDCPLAKSSTPGTLRFDLESSDIRIRE